jgi:hypothetical protein
MKATLAAASRGMTHSSYKVPFSLWMRFLLFSCRGQNTNRINMSIKLFGAASSWNTLRARHALLEKGVTVEEVTLNLSAQDQKVTYQPSYLEELGVQQN